MLEGSRRTFLGRCSPCLVGGGQEGCGSWNALRIATLDSTSGQGILQLASDQSYCSGVYKMAKKTVNKSEEIRTVLAATPAASPKEVVATLKKKGIDVSENLVYGVKQDLAKKAPKAKATAKAAAPAKVAASSPNVHL